MMKRLTTILGLLLCLVLNAQLPAHKSLYEEIAEDRSRAGGVYYMYDFDTPRIVPKAPKGYQPFYISHYGRHGARYIYKNVMYDYVFEVLSKAHEDGKLTPEGEEAYTKVSAIYPSLKGKAGLLSQKGADQQKMLARRMYTNYPAVFKGNKVVKAGSTDIIRCVLSMSYFCSGLTAMNPKLDIRMESNELTSATYNHVWLNSMSKYVTQEDRTYNSPDAPWYPDYIRFCDEKKANLSVHDKVFSDLDYAHEKFDLVSFQQYLFFFACNMGCTEFDDVDLFNLFSVQDLANLAECDVYTYYESKGGSKNYHDRCALLCTVLLDELLDTTNDDILKGDVAARLRFGHDGNIMSLYNLMGFDDWKEVSDNPSDITSKWRLYDIPMAANIQMVFYRSKNASEPILMRFMHNENTLTLKDLPQDLAPYYRWEDFYNYYKGISEAAKK